MLELKNTKFYKPDKYVFLKKRASTAAYASRQHVSKTEEAYGEELNLSKLLASFLAKEDLYDGNFISRYERIRKNEIPVIISSDIVSLYFSKLILNNRIKIQHLMENDQYIIIKSNVFFSISKNELQISGADAMSKQMLKNIEIIGLNKYPLFNNFQTFSIYTNIYESKLLNYLTLLYIKAETYAIYLEEEISLTNSIIYESFIINQQELQVVQYSVKILNRIYYALRSLRDHEYRVIYKSGNSSNSLLNIKNGTIVTNFNSVYNVSVDINGGRKYFVVGFYHIEDNACKFIMNKEFLNIRESLEDLDKAKWLKILNTIRSINTKTESEIEVLDINDRFTESTMILNEQKMKTILADSNSSLVNYDFDKYPRYKELINEKASILEKLINYSDYQSESNKDEDYDNTPF